MFHYLGFMGLYVRYLEPPVFIILYLLLLVSLFGSMGHFVALFEYLGVPAKINWSTGHTSSQSQVLNTSCSSWNMLQHPDRRWPACWITRRCKQMPTRKQLGRVSDSRSVEQIGTTNK